MSNNNATQVGVTARRFGQDAVLKAAPVEKWYAAAEQQAEDGLEDTAHVTLEFASLMESVQHINTHLDDVQFTAVTLIGKNLTTGTEEKFTLTIPDVTPEQG